MRFLILRILTHSELGMFHEYRRQGKEGSKQRAVNFDWDVVDRVFPAARDSDRIDMNLKYDTDKGIAEKKHWLKRQEKNWRLEGNCPTDKCYHFVVPGCLFAMEVDAGTSPASGSWAVFPAKSPVTKAILADGESSRLAKSAMIALHDEEGEHTWEILADARPDLFMSQQNGARDKSSRRKNRQHQTAIFLHGCFWHRHSGCRNATTPSTRPEFWQEKFDGNVVRDARNRADLEAAGWTVLTVWECELKADAEGVVRRLSHELREDG